MSLLDPSKQERIEGFLRKSLLGDELINTQFHLFSARSLPSDRVIKPRVLCANNVLLAKSSKYFLDLLGTDIHPSDPLMSDLTDSNDVPNNAPIDRYGYASDSDLDDEEEESTSVVNSEEQRDRSVVASTSSPQSNVTSRPQDDDELSDDGSESVGSDMFVMSPEHPRANEPLPMSTDGTRSAASSETVIQEAQGNTRLAGSGSAALRLRSLGSRHVLVKDTAFQTWYTLLNYLYTGKFSFLPLSSAVPRVKADISSTSSLDGPKCSAKSMYRLACKIGLDSLRDEALAHIRSNLSQLNVLRELSCSLVSRHPELLEMELDVLYAHIASPSVVAGFPTFARRIALRELPHGADIIVGIHARVLRERKPPSPSTSPVLAPDLLSPAELPQTLPFADPLPANDLLSPTDSSRSVDPLSPADPLRLPDRVGICEAPSPNPLPLPHMVPASPLPGNVGIYEAPLPWMDGAIGNPSGLAIGRYDPPAVRDYAVPEPPVRTEFDADADEGVLVSTAKVSRKKGKKKK